MSRNTNLSFDSDSNAGVPRLRIVSIRVLLALTLAMNLGAMAQTVNSTLRGTASDSSGSAVANAEINLYEPATGQLVRHAVTNESGDFEFAELKPGVYELRCTLTGFKLFVAKNVVMDSGQTRRVNPMLALGEVAEQVTVTAGAAVISTESPMISGLFTAKQHDETPQVTLYPTTYSMLTTLSGVQGGTGTPIANGQTQTSADTDIRWNPKRSSWCTEQ